MSTRSCESRVSTPPGPQDRAGRPLQRSRLALSVSGAVGLFASFGLPLAALAQTLVGPGNLSSYTNVTTGAAGQTGQGSSSAPQPGGPGQSPSALTVVFQPQTYIVGAGSSPTVSIGLVGGAGGLGNDAEGHNQDGKIVADTGGDGGVGGTPGLLTWTVSNYINLVSSSGPYAVQIFSLGGAGGFAGGYQKDYGFAGTPGAGGAGGDIQVSLGGSIYSSNGWNGATPGTTALAVSSIGADGGANPNLIADNSASAGLYSGDVTGHPGGAGGNGGNILMTSQIANVHSAAAGMMLLSQGGNGSDGSMATANGGKGTGGAGGAGGSGGTVNLTLGDPSQPNFSIVSVGAATPATGLDIPVTEPDQNGNQIYAQASYPAPAIQLQSLGGNGGLGGEGGGSSGAGGAGGASGSGGNVILSYSAMGLSTTGFAAPGVVAQSVGGSGGNGADAGGSFKRKGGSGGTGGDGGSVNLNFFDWNGATQNSVLQTAGDDSPAIVAQSIGGGGGVGGSVSVASLIGAVAIGGQGESGGLGGTVTVTNGGGTDPNDKPDAGIVIQTAGTRASGIVAQSIGGGGGTGGSAQSTAIGPFAYAVGGSGGSGGNAGTPGTVQVSVTNAGIVATGGDHSRGIEAQAIGGGGGSGGSASTLTASGQLNVNVSVGGQGGAGGNAGDVNVQNPGQITTQGADAWGLVAQSIGGGGGNGGMSKADALQLASSSELPSMTVSIDLGGQGGSAGNGGNVTVGNGFSIMTAGPGAHGLIAQSIGGGGGNGGDSSSLVGQIQGSTFTYSVSAGGSGGSGGGTGQVSVDNNGLIWTMGQDSYAVLAQSISGGGGSGGLGSSDTSAFSSSNASKFTIAIGGEGANGADANQVTVNNYSGVLTTGDGSGALFAQSIGGGGGNGGGAIGYGTGGTVSAVLGIGGKGGSGGNGGSVNVNNYSTGAIVTTGAGAPAIFAQSVGGTGGNGGRGAVSGGVSPVTLILDYLKTGDLAANYTQSYGDSDTFVQAWKNTAGDLFGKGVQSLVSLAADYLKANNGGLSPAQGSGGGSFNLNVNVGTVQTGSGGSGGSGGSVTVLNEGQILTQGPASSGIQAQSVGGGGGSAGSVLVGTGGSFVPENVVANVVIGGAGGAAGNGGLVSITNYNQVTTQGDQSHGLVAQSVGGGGGLAGYTGSPASGRGTYGFTLGGDGGANGNGGGYGGNVPGVSVENFAATVGTAVVRTSGDDAVGIVAQNIGGGGGLMSFMYAVADGNGGVVSTSSQGNLSTPVALTLSAKTAPAAAGCDSKYLVAACGNAGEAYVTSDTIGTSGRNSHGVVAQSIGGGGGALLGGTLTGNDFFANSATSMGNGGQVQVNIRGPLTTTGDGAIGVIAQSIGGGGLLGGDIASASAVAPRPSNFQGAATPSFFQGDGGEVDVNVVQGGSIRTSGAFAHGIYAQSNGGGGGLIVSKDGGWIDGSGGGIGSAGAINVQVDGIVTTAGQGAIGVYANSDGSAASAQPVNITVTATGAVGSQQSDAILINSSATTNTVTNSGTISGAVGQAAVAVANGGNSAVNVSNSAGGNIYGNISLKGGTLTNAGNWYPDGANAGNVVSTGTIGVALGRTVPSSPGTLPKVLLIGNLQHSGVLQTTVDFAKGQASELLVTGTANLTGAQFSLLPSSVGPTPVTILTAGTLTLGQNTVYDNGQLGVYGYQLSTPSSNVLQVTQQAQMSVVARNAGFSRTEQSVAQHLDAGFAADALPGRLGDLYTKLGQISDLPQFKQALDSLANEAINSVGPARQAESHSFVTRMNSCPEFEGTGTLQAERECVWGRAIGDWTDRQSSTESIGYKGNSSGMQFGGQTRIAPGWFAGGSLAYGTSSLEADSVSSQVDGRSATLGLILKHEIGQWLLSGAADAGYGWYDSTRAVTLGNAGDIATASFNGQHAGLHARVAYQIPEPDWYLKPYVDLHAVYQRTGSYTESGAGGLGLDVAGASATRFAIAPMLEIGGRVDISSGWVLKPVFTIGGTFFDKNEWATQARLIGSSAAPFTVTSTLPTSMFDVGLGAVLMRSEKLQLRLEYSGQFASGYRSNAASLKLSYLF